MPSRDSHSFLSFPFWRTCIRRRSKVRATVLDYFQPGTSWPLEFLDVSRQIRPYLSHLLRRGQDRAYRFDRDRHGTRYGTSFDYMKNERYFFQIYLSTFVSIVRRYGCRRGSIYCDKHTLKRNTLCQKHTNGINSIARTMRMFEKILMGNCCIFQNEEILFTEFYGYRINRRLNLVE